MGPVLAQLARSARGPHEIRVTTVGDVATLLSGFHGRGRLILQGDGFPEEDIGFVRRFLAANPQWSLVLVGRDAGTRPARILLGLERTRWLNLPPDLDQMRDLVRYPAFLEPPPWEDQQEPAEPAVSELAAEPLPNARVAPRPTAPPAPSPPPDPAPRATPRAPEAAPAPVPGPPLKAHVAALADIAQRLELSISAVQDGERVDGALDGPASELSRLRRFTRMLAHVAAPPPRGSDEFDLGELFEERLAALTIESPSTMRFLPRGERGHLVRADRAAVLEALGCVLELARTCGAPDGLVKAPYGSRSPGRVTLGVEFPAGPLSGADPATLLTPGAPGGLAEHLPDYGPADLAAAATLARSQGGDLRLLAVAGERLLAELEFPLAD